MEDSKLVKENQNSTAGENQQYDATLGKKIGALGGAFPVVVINGYTFSSREILYLEVKDTGFLPTCELRIQLTGNGIFISKHFPKDGDLISVFLRSFIDTLKPIACDFLITNVRSNVSMDSEGSSLVIDFDGVLRIPKIFAEVSKSIKKTSIEALFDIATELKLGFASNETTTDDLMTWISPSSTYKAWIEEITRHAWKDTESFFTSYVDHNYTLHFNNLNKIMAVKDSEPAKDGLMRSTQKEDFNPDDNLSHGTTKNILTNSPDYKGNNYYVSGIEFINNSGMINITNGYKRFVSWYEKIKKEKLEIYTEALTTKGAEKEKVILKGRAKENIYQEEIKKKWAGIQYSLPDYNCHNFYSYAKYHNLHNLIEVNKLNIVAHLPHTNFNLYRGQRIPLVFILTKDSERIKVAGSPKDLAKTTGFSVDRFITGNYVITGIHYIYRAADSAPNQIPQSHGFFEQSVILSRREWSMPTVPALHEQKEKTESL